MIFRNFEIVWDYVRVSFPSKLMIKLLFSYFEYFYDGKKKLLSIFVYNIKECEGDNWVKPS